MRFYEHESKTLFARHGLPLGRRGLARSAAEAARVASEIGGPVVLKSQVLSGGRMKAGAVRFAETPEEAREKAMDLVDIISNELVRTVETSRIERRPEEENDGSKKD